MKRSILFTTALAAALGSFALGAAQAQGPAGNGNGAQAGGQVLLPQQRSMSQTQAQKRVTNEYRYEYRNGEYDDDAYGTPSNYRERIRDASRVRDQWKNMDEVASGLRAEGYQIRKIEMERYGYEAKVRDRDGRRLELRLDPMSGAVIGSELD